MSATPRDPATTSQLAAKGNAAITSGIDANTAIRTLSDCPCTLTQLACPATIDAYMPEPLLAQLSELGRAYAADLSTTLLAAFAICLTRYFGQASIHVSAGLLLPPHDSLAPAPPELSTPASFDIELSTTATFGHLLAGVVDRLPPRLAPAANGSAEPAKLTYQCQPRGCTRAYSQQRRQRDGELRLGISTARDEQATTWLYHIGQIEPAMLAQLHQHFLVLLSALVAEPAQPLTHLPLLAEGELRQLLVEWNATSAPYDTTQCIHQLFEAQAARTPDAIALVFGSERISYRTLNRRANRLARHLRELGAGPDALIGLCLDRSPAQIISVLAILKAGGAYVPLDPAYPAERLAWMIEDTQAPLLITSQRLAGQLAAPQTQLVCVDQLDQATDETDDQNVSASTRPQNLAYVIYTSGSTGVPKGVLIDHAGLVNHTFAMVESHAMDQRDRVLQFSSLGFDASAATLFPALITGAMLVLPAASASELLGDQLTQLCEQQQITILQLPASIWHRWVDDLLVRGAPLALPLKVLLVGGESPSADKLRDWLRLLGRPVIFLNAYGPTEATITATLYSMVCDEASATSLTSIPMGRPLANKQIYLLDSNQQPVPVGAPGEVYIGGVGLARGYLNRPALTAERFIDWQIPSGGATRLYRTGDLARFRPDGNIEFIGRVDHQIKLRGFRIELGEIEHILRQHELVRDALVLVREDTPGLQQLVAYIVVTKPSLTASQQVRTATEALLHRELHPYLRAKLPAYMVPAAFVALAALPLTHNGKVDRRALPPPDTSSPPAEAIAGPRTPEESVLADIWAKALGRTRVGIHDDFFALGGHSLLAARAMVLVNASLNRNIPMRVLYEAPTVAAFAEAMHRDPSQVQAVYPSDLAADALLDPSITPAPTTRLRPGAPAEAIFLTGSTGFIGAFLLGELLTSTSARIYCLVRAENSQKGAQRIRTILTNYQIWRDEWSERIIPVTGDLRQPRFGLSAPAFQRLASMIDLIYHAGAEVHYLYPYSALKAANVLGTIEIIRLACETFSKPVHYVSSIAVATINGHDNSAPHEDVLNAGSNPVGYAQSKWVAEELMQLARGRGLPVTIYQPGRVGSHSQNGSANSNDFFVRLLAGCIQIGLAPDIPMVENLVPVDYAAQAIVQLSRQPGLANQTFHLLNPTPTAWHDIVQMIQGLGYPLQLMPYLAWYNALAQAATAENNQTLHSLLLLLPPQEQDDASWTNDWINQAFDLQRVAALLHSSGVTCPTITPELIERLLDYGLERKLFVAPSLMIS